MADKTTGLLNIDSKNLAAKFIRMGVAPPADVNQMTRDRLDYIVTALPAVYESSFAVRNGKDELVIQRMFDISPEGLNDQIVSWLQKQDLKALPEQREVNQCTVEAWQGLFKRPAAELNVEELSKSFSNWGFDVNLQTLSIGFENNSEMNIQEAEHILNESNQELVSRLVATGIVPPLDIDNVSPSEAQEIIKELPALTSREIVYNINGENERISFIDISENGLNSQVQKFSLLNEIPVDEIIHQSDDICFGLDWLDYFKQGVDQVDPSRNGVQFFPEGLGISGAYQTSLLAAVNDLQTRLEPYGIEGISAETIEKGLTVYSQEVLCEADESYTKRFAALDQKELEAKINSFLQENNIEKYSKMEISEHPVIKGKSYQLRELQNGLKEWNMPFTIKHLEHGFSKDIEKIKNFSRLKFCKTLISKTVAAGIIEAIPLEKWKALTLADATEIVQAIPSGGKIVTSGDWLKLFRQSKDKINKEGLEEIFKNVHIEFNEEKVMKCFPEKTQEEKSMKKQIVYASEQEKKALYSLIKEKKIEPISQDEMNDMTSNEVKEIIKEYDSKASDKQKSFILKLSKEGKIEPPLTEKDIKDLKRHEAGIIISSTLQANGMENGKKYVHFASKEQRDILRTYMNRGKIERMDLDEWKKLSFEKAQDIIASISTKDPLTSGQKKTILDLHTKGILDLSKKFDNPVISEKDIDSLTFGEASKLIGNIPASDKQIETIKGLIKNGRLKKDIHTDSLTKTEASKFINTGFRETGTQDNSPATENPVATDKQKDRIAALVKAKKIPALTPEQEKNLSKANASIIIGSSPASQTQKNKVTELVKGGKLEKLPYDQFAKMTSSQANEFIKNGIANNTPSTATPEKAATEAQVAKLHELYKTGKLNKLPAAPTASQASKLISDGVASSVITQNQQAVVKKMIERKQIPNMIESEIKGMKQGEFSKLLKSNPLPSGNKEVACSQKEYKQLAELVKSGHLKKLPMSNWKTLTKQDALKLIKQGTQARGAVSPPSRER